VSNALYSGHPLQSLCCAFGLAATILILMGCVVFPSDLWRDCWRECGEHKRLVLCRYKRLVLSVCRGLSVWASGHQSHHGVGCHYSATLQLQCHVSWSFTPSACFSVW
jgi:hypothetical protein